MVALTAVQLNYIIFRYLTESEFSHTAFMFDCEASASKIPFDGNLIPPAILVKLVQKGLQLMEMEENLKMGENDVDKEFFFVQAVDLIKKVENEELKVETDKEKNQHLNRASKLSRKGKLRKARERGEAYRKALQKEEADREAQDKEEADKKAREKEEAGRKARKKEEVDRGERRGRRIRIKRKKVVNSDGEISS